MIVPAELEHDYNGVRPLLLSVQGKAESLLRGIAYELGGRFAGVRIKPTESLYMKLERDGRSVPLLDLEDLVAGTIVIPNKILVQKVETAILERFDRVKTIPVKTNRPEEFIYDDRHVIVRLKPDALAASPDEGLVNIEIQIKTEMQAASSAITRELSYKPKTMSWSKARLASQIRALVEVADNLLAALEEAEQEVADPDDRGHFNSRNELLGELDQRFPEEELPSDRRRFAAIVGSMLRDCRPPLSASDLGILVREDRHRDILEAKSLSVIQKIFLILLEDRKIIQVQGDVPQLLGARSYIVTETMEALCAAAKQIPLKRRMSWTPPAPPEPESAEVHDINSN